MKLVLSFVNLNLCTNEGMVSSMETQQIAIELVMDFERDNLEYLNKSSLASSIKELANEEGSNVFDIHSFNSDGSDKYIKVIASSNNSISGFPITDTELKLIANAAIIGDKRIPKNGNKTPAAIGTPKVL